MNIKEEFTKLLDISRHTRRGIIVAVAILVATFIIAEVISRNSQPIASIDYAQRDAFVAAIDSMKIETDKQAKAKKKKTKKQKKSKSSKQYPAPPSDKDLDEVPQY